MALDTLIAAAMLRIRHGKLPCFKSSVQYAGSGSGEECGLCQTHITDQEVGYEVVSDGPQPADQPPLYLHVRCHHAWVEACRESSADGSVEETP